MECFADMVYLLFGQKITQGQDSPLLPVAEQNPYVTLGWSKTGPEGHSYHTDHTAYAS